MINSLKVFLVVAAEQSFSGAARRLGMSQPSVSEHIRSLENSYGVALFERTGRDVVLTAAGARLYEHGGRIMAALEDFERDLEGLKQGTRGVLEMAASPIPGEAILPLLLPRFQTLHPGVQVRERIASNRTVVDQVLRREVELGLIAGPFHDDRLEEAHWARDEFVLVARRDHPLAGRGPLHLSEVCQYPLVLRGEGSSAWIAVEAALSAAGVSRDSLKIAAELGNTSAVKRAVEAGLGVAFVSICALAASGPAGELRTLPLADEPPSRDLLVITERGRALTALSQTFRRFLLSTETLRQVESYTRLPAFLRGDGDSPDEPKAAPKTGLERDPLLPPHAPGGPIYRLARVPTTRDESLVAKLLAETYRGGRAALIERLADELRRRDGDPLASTADVGLYRLEVYREEATALVDGLLGDMLVEVERW